MFYRRQRRNFKVEWKSWKRDFALRQNRFQSLGDVYDSILKILLPRDVHRDDWADDLRLYRNDKRLKLSNLAPHCGFAQRRDVAFADYRLQSAQKVIAMLNNLTAPKLFALTVATIAVTAFLTGIVIVFEPPAFIGYGFGFLSGANWLLLLVIYIRYLDESS